MSLEGVEIYSGTVLDLARHAFPDHHGAESDYTPRQSLSHLLARHTALSYTPLTLCGVQRG